MIFFQLLWVLISLVLIYFTIWTYGILLRQKKTWKAFADKYNLRYFSKSFFGAPTINGLYDGYTIAFFTGEHYANNAPNGGPSRKLTAMEVELETKLPFESVMASGGMVQVAEEFQLNEEFRPDFEGWKNEYVVRTKSRPFISAYLTPERLQVLTDLMKIKNAWVILIFKQDTSLLRIDLPAPLSRPKRLQALVNKMIATAKALEADKSEVGRLESASPAKDSKGTLHVNEEQISNIGLELDEDFSDAEEGELDETSRDESSNDSANKKSSE